MSNDTIDATIQKIKSEFQAAKGCSNNTLKLLETLLGLQDAASATKASAKLQASRNRPPLKELKQPKTSKQPQSTRALSDIDRGRLATEVINVSLKVLTEAVRTQVTARPNSKSPNVSAKSGRGSKSVDYQDGIRCMVRSAQVAFATLYSTGITKSPEKQDFRLEAGLSAFVGKLLALELIEAATSELMTLMNRLKQRNTGRLEASTSRAAQLPSLLTTVGRPLDKQCLSIVISSQLHCLKLMAYSDCKDAGAVLKNLQTSEPCGPYALIAYGLDSQFLSTNEACKMFRSLIHCLSTFKPRKQTQTQESASCILQIQLLSLSYLIRADKLIGHQTDFANGVVNPLGKYIRTFMQGEVQIEEGLYAAVSVDAMDIIAESEKALQGLQDKDKALIELSNTRSMLSLMASRSANKTDPLRHSRDTDKYLERPEMSSFDKIRALSNLCSERIESGLGIEAMEEAISTLIGFMRAGVDASMQESDSVLIAISTLRRKVVEILRPTLLSSANDTIQKAASSVGLYSDLLARITDFVLHFLEANRNSKKSNEEDGRKQRVAMVNRIARPTIDSMLMLTRAMHVLGQSRQMALFKSLQQCTLIIEGLDIAVSESVIPALDERLSDVHTKLSDQLMALYIAPITQKLPTSSTIQLLDCSVQVMATASNLVKANARYAERISRMIRANEGESGSDRACHGLKLLARHCRDSGALDRAMIKAAHPKGSQSKTDLDDMSLLQRTASTFIRLQPRTNAETLSEFFSAHVDIKDLDRSGFLAECEMNISVSVLQYGGAIKGDMMAAPSLALRTLYLTQNRPVRRLRVIAWVVQVAQFWPDVANADLVASCRQELLEYKLENHAEDADLIEQAPLLLTLSQVSLAWSGDKMNIDLVQSALATWSRLLRRGSSAVSLQFTGLPMVWKQMCSLADYLHAHCLTEEYETTLAVLDLLCDHDICETPEDKTAVVIRRVKAKLDAGQLEEAYSLALHLETSQPSGSLSLADAQLLTTRAAIAVDLGDTDAAKTHLDVATKALSKPLSQPVPSAVRIRIMLTIAEILRVHADLQEALGSAGRSLFYARAASKAMHTAWRSALKKSQLNQSLLMQEGGRPEPTTISTSDPSHSSVQPGADLSRASTSGVLKHATGLIKAFTDLSKRLADAGMIQEARQYLRQAERLAETFKLRQRLRFIQVVSASFSTNEGNFETSIGMLAGIVGKSKDIGLVQLKAELELCKALWLSGNVEEAQQRIDESRDRFPSSLALEQRCDPVKVLERGIKSLNLGGARSVAARHERISSKVSRSNDDKTIVQSEKSNGEQSTYLQSMLHQRHFLQLSMALADSDSADLVQLINSPIFISATPQDKIRKAVLHAKFWLREALSTLALDPIFSSLGDAPLSYPASMKLLAADATVVETSKPAPRQRRTTAKQKAKVKVQSKSAGDGTALMPTKSLVAFQKASIGLKEVIQLAQTGGDTGILHELAYDLTRVSMFVAAAQKMDKSQLPYELAAALEVGRSSAWQRQISAARGETMLSSLDEMAPLTMDSIDSELEGSYKWSLDSFQTEYVDIIPRMWTVVSLSLSSDRRELQVSRLRQGSTPFVLSLPLGRNFDGTDDDELSFDMAREELADIVGLANYSTHDSSDMNRKGAKTEWWNTRTALDERLRNLLENMDKTWLSGFSGIFNQPPAVPGAFEAFRDRFLKVLSDHLPSRKSRAAAKNTRFVDLNVQVLELFTCLRQPLQNGDLDEPLLDLLAYVVDILQFNGERNAFDEIDFDAMVLDLLDALGQYHQAAERELPTQGEASHTVLILDKHLHCFPWESMPCLKGASVSRLPTLEMLRERILAQRESTDWQAHQDAFVVDSTDGTCILNPAGDLLHTERTFSEPLSKLPESWSTVIRRAPEETELAQKLSSRSIYVYLGHGSGGQYIRSRTVKKLDRCAVSLLLGCSSATVIEAGQYESYGTPLTYLQGGAPAVVGTLWDVTDKDIDKFSLKMLHRWGLFEDKEEKAEDKREAPKPLRGRKKTVAKEVVREVRVGLDTAVAEAREECLMRYLNGAAPVVYGVPVILR